MLTRSHGVTRGMTPLSWHRSSARNISLSESWNRVSRSSVYCEPRSSLWSPASPVFEYNDDRSRIWNFTQSAPDSTAASISSNAKSRLPLWLLPISAMSKQGLPGPMFRPARAKGASRGRAIATHRPSGSVRGTMWTLSSNLASIRVTSSVIRAEVKSRLMISPIGWSRSGCVSHNIQRRMSPSVRIPWRMPVVSTQTTMPSSLSSILWRTSRTDSSSRAR